jgi:hypothetical protein
MRKFENPLKFRPIRIKISEKFTLVLDYLIVGLFNALSTELPLYEARQEI